MATYDFETITAAQALAITPQDVVLFRGASSTLIDVLYGPDRITVVHAGQHVEFGLALSQASILGNLQFADGSKLFIGNDGANFKSFQEMWNPAAQFGGAGDDTLTGSFGDNFVHGNAGNDEILVFGGRNGIYGGKGDDKIIVARSGPTQPGSFVHGNMGADVIQGGAGPDTLLGGQDNDSIYGNEGIDYISGDLGNDFIVSSVSGSWTFGGPGADTIHGGWDPGRHYLEGGDGDDRILARSQWGGLGGSNTVDGGSGADTLTSSSSAHDRLSGGAGDDSLMATQDHPSLERDHLFGGDGADILLSDKGGDTLNGEDGRDTFMVSNGKAILYGGGGADIFQLAPKDLTSAALVDEVRDWSSEDSLSLLTSRLGSRAHVAAYTERSAADFAEALSTANAAMQGGAYQCVAVQVGVDVMVFADVIGGDGRADAAIILSGTTLDNISRENLL